MWFAAKLLFESSIRHDDGRMLQEESIRLIQANDEAEARSKAASLGVAEQHNYPNACGENVNWQFVSILELQDLCEANLVDGMEVFSTMKWLTVDRVEPSIALSESR
jgi:hypothetical protein